MDWPKVIIHIDADAFFAAIEIRDNPDLKGKPVIIGARPGSRGVVSTCSYELENMAFVRLCPYPQRIDCALMEYISGQTLKYSESFGIMFDICAKYSPIVEKTSIDEGYLDVTSNGKEIAENLKKEIREKIGITISAGVAYCRYLSKLAAEMNKPDGLGIIGPGDAQAFLKDLPVGKLPSVGPKLKAKLNNLGIYKTGELAALPEQWFTSNFGKFGKRLHQLSLGIDHESVGQPHEVKSISEETTFEQDIHDTSKLQSILAKLTQDVGYRLRKRGFLAKTLGIKVRYSDFHTINREISVPVPVDSDSELYALAKSLFIKIKKDKPIRLIGVGVKNFTSKKYDQQSLFSQTQKSWATVSKVIDSLREKYGAGIVALGASLPEVLSEGDSGNTSSGGIGNEEHLDQGSVGRDSGRHRS